MNQLILIKGGLTRYRLGKGGRARLGPQKGVLATEVRERGGRSKQKALGGEQREGRKCEGTLSCRHAPREEETKK